MIEKIRWGILGTGTIAKKFATGLQALKDAELLAVGSRSQAGADAFANQFNVKRPYGTYEALVQDADIDAVYIGTPHSAHKQNTLLCLDHGKAVLCEKPFAINAIEAKLMVQRARQKGIFLMEAMWSRYLPVMQRLRELLAEGVIGELVQLTADFGFQNTFDPAHRLYDPALGGGALLDIGVYPISLASMVLGPPDQVQSLAYLGKSGIDENAAILLGYRNRPAIAMLSATIQAHSHRSAIISGSKGKIRLHAPWWKTPQFTLEVDGHENIEIEAPVIGNGYNYQAAEVGRCLRAGLQESGTMPLNESLSIMKTMDKIRAQWGLKYPMEAG